MEINWRATRLLTANADVVVIPNSNISKAVVINRSRPDRSHVCSVYLTFCQAVSPMKAEAILLSAAAEVQAILKTPAPTVYVQDIAEFGVRFELDFHVADFGLSSSAKSEVLQRIWRNAQKEGIEFPTFVTNFEANRLRPTHSDAIGTVRNK